MATTAEAFSFAVNCMQVGRLVEAEQLCRMIVAIDPSFADAWHLLGVIALQGGQHELAVENLQRALALNPTDTEALNNLGITLKSLAQWDEAIERFRGAVAIRPDFGEAQYNLANALHEQGRTDEAIDAYRRAIQVRPNDPVIHNGLGMALENQGSAIAAVASYRAAIALKPDYALAHSNLGIALREMGEVSEAIASLRQASALEPNTAEIMTNFGAALQDGGRISEAIDCYRRAMELEPGLAPIRVNHAYLMLLTGDLQKGWQEYEWRWKVGDIVERSFRQPKWEGQPLHGKTVLLHAEQGLGDTIQFVRYAPIVKRLGGTVIFDPQKPLLNLLASSAGIDYLVGRDNEIPSFDFHIPLLSLPGVFNTSLETIPNTVPYLFADPALRESWREKLNGVPGFKIGINWHGRAGRHESLRRDIPPRCFASFANLPGISLISLQQNPGREELERISEHIPVHNLGNDIDTAHGAFMDTAAIMMNLDLVITSDTSVAHLAGALGVPVWVPLPFVPNWRWLLDRSDSPWYPTMRLFRQNSPGAWPGVFEEIKARLVQKFNLSNPNES